MANINKVPLRIRERSDGGNSMNSLYNP
jgi:hypothetical protein